MTSSNPGDSMTGDQRPPRAARQTSARPEVVDGVTFNCFSTGILRYQWRSEDGRLAAGSNPSRSSYYAQVDGERFSKRFRSLKNAMRAAVKAAGSTTGEER